MMARRARSRAISHTSYWNIWHDTATSGGLEYGVTARTLIDAAVR
jgi:hypothetical protein